MRLLGTRILVKQDNPTNETASGIIISATKPEKPNRGTVVLTGSGLAEEPLEVKQGQYIQFRNNAGIPADFNGEPHLIMDQSDIQAVLG